MAGGIGGGISGGQINFNFYVGLKVFDLHALVPARGNYCGPGWTGGTRGAVNDDPERWGPSVDDFDEKCKTHDAKYGEAGRIAVSNPSLSNKILNSADRELVSSTFSVMAERITEAYLSAPDDLSGTLMVGGEMLTPQFLYSIGVVSIFSVIPLIRGGGFLELPPSDDAMYRDDGLIATQQGFYAILDMPDTARRAFDNPDGPEARMIRAIVDGHEKDAALAAMQIDQTPGVMGLTDVYQDSILRAIAGYEDHTSQDARQDATADYLLIQKAQQAANRATATPSSSHRDRDPDPSPANLSTATPSSRHRDRDPDPSPSNKPAVVVPAKPFPGTTPSVPKDVSDFNQNYNRDRQATYVDHTATEDRRPILLDLNNNGIEIAGIDRAPALVTGDDGLQHRTSWAGVGDGV